jgi:Mg-chelatase subunit ChlD
MTARFRCPECRQPLSSRQGDDPTKGCVLKCPECGARLVVPAAVASLPHPQIDAPSPLAVDDGPLSPAHHPDVLPVMARSMPWLMSMFVHVALAMIFMFIAMITVIEPAKTPAGVPNLHTISQDTPNFTQLPPKTRQDSALSNNHRRKRGAELQTLTRVLESFKDENVIGPAADLTGLKQEEGIAKLSGRRGEDDFFTRDPKGRGNGGRAPDVVFLIDRSGSMVDTFDAVRREMLLSIEKLKPERRFHVVLFSDGTPLEKLPRAMTLATDTAKVGMVKFLSPIRASGKTDPIPAINRAFDAIERGSVGKSAIIHLLTDGVFPDNDAVLKTIRRRNSSGRVLINTILYGNRPPIAEEVMSRIASENGGKYRFISRDE